MRPIMIAVTLVVSACGAEEELTCEVMADPSSCWNRAAAAVAACLPDEIATLSPDRASCSFSDGTEVVFDETLPSSTDAIASELMALGFSVEKGGEQCARFVDTLRNRMEIYSSDGNAVAELHSNRAFHLHCDDTSYGADFDRVFECAAEGIAPPTDGFELTETSLSFSISSAATPGELFRCETEAANASQ